MSKSLLTLLLPLFDFKLSFGDGDVAAEPAASTEAVIDVPATDTPSGEPEKEAEKTLTQAEVDDIVQKRLAKERRKIEREVRLETENAAYKAAANKEVVAPASTEKPHPDNFATYELFLEALTDYKVAERDAVRVKEQEAAKQQEADNNRVKTYAEKANKAREVYTDFDEVVDQDLPVSRAMIEVITESELGADIAYYLGKHPQDAIRIAALSPLAAAREIGKIEAKLTPAEKTIETPSKAPKPVSPVKGNATPTNTPSDNDSMADWLAKRNKQLRRA